jgi:hypothetical protein
VVNGTVKKLKIEREISEDAKTFDDELINSVW